MYYLIALKGDYKMIVPGVENSKGTGFEGHEYEVELKKVLLHLDYYIDLRKKEEQEGISVDNEVIKYIAEVINTNIRELEGALNKIKMMSKLEGKKIDVEFAKEVLKDTVSPNEKRILTPEYILDIVCDHFSVNKLDIVSNKRTKELVYPRQIAMYLMKKLTNCSLDYIGNLLGGRDHSTILHGIDKIKAEYNKNDDLKHDISVLEKKLSTQ